MAEVQTTLLLKKIPKLEEYQKENGKALEYLLEKYPVWKQLKHKEKGEANGISKP